MVSRGVDQDTEKEIAARKARRAKQGRELWSAWRSAAIRSQGGIDEDIPTKHTPSNSTATSTPTTPAPAHAINGPITRSRAKKLQQEVHALLCEIHFYINENYILPKCCTLVVLRYIEEEKDKSDPEERTSASSTRSQKQTSERNLHNFLLTKSMKVHEHLLESLTSLLSNESSGDQFGYSILLAEQN